MTHTPSSECHLASLLASTSFPCVRYALLYESDLIIPLSTAVEDMLKNGKPHTPLSVLDLLLSLTEEGAGRHVLQTVGNVGADIER